MPSGRTVCAACSGQLLEVFIGGRKTLLDWPSAANGDVAVEHTVAGSWLGRHAPVGVPLSLVEHRYQRHACEPQPDLSEPQRPPVFLDDYKRGLAAHNAAMRRTRPRQQQTTGYRITPGSSK